MVHFDTDFIFGFGAIAWQQGPYWATASWRAILKNRLMMAFGEQQSEAIGQRTTIGILEDNEDIGFVLEYFLNEEGFRTVLYPSANAFRSFAFSEPPELFLMDVMLPDGDGAELCRELKGDSRFSDIPVVLMSAHAGLDASRLAGADEFIGKPFDLDFLLVRIRRLLKLDIQSK